MSYPKDLLEAIEERTGGNYFNDYLENKDDLLTIYETTSEDLLNLVITLKGNIYEILKNPKKYVINEETKKLLEELIEYKNRKEN